MRQAKVLLLSVVVVSILAGCGAAAGQPEAAPADAGQSSSPYGVEYIEQPTAPYEAETIKDWRNAYTAKPVSQKDLLNDLRLTDAEFFKKYRPGRLIRLDAEGIRRGYLYRDLGICVSFDAAGRMAFIDCRDGFEFYGVKAGMGFDRIKTILGEAPVRTAYFGARKVHILEYTLDECVAQFIAGDKNGADDGASFLRVLPRRDVVASAGKEEAKPGATSENPLNDSDGWWKAKYQGSPLGKEELVGLVSLTKGEILEKYGYDYAIVRTGAEGLLQGYFFRQLGVCITFRGYDKVAFVDCSPGVGIDGATVGMSFDEVMAILGETPIKPSWYESPDIKIHLLEYQMGNAIVRFVSLERSEPNNRVWRVTISPNKSARE